MRRRILTIFALCLSVLLILVVGSAVAKEKKAKQGQLNGTVHMLNKDTSTITIMKANAQRQVVYNNDTKWMYGVQSDAKPSSLDQLKEGWDINCKGKFDGVKVVPKA